MKTKKFILIIVVLLILTGCTSKTKENATQNQNKKGEEFSLKQQCYKYKDDIDKKIKIFNAEQKLEKRGDNDGSFNYCKEIQELKEIFYSNKINSCTHVIIEKTLCQPDQNTAFSISYEYQNLFNTLTNEKIESFRTISRGEVYESADAVQAKINKYKNIIE